MAAYQSNLESGFFSQEEYEYHIANIGACATVMSTEEYAVLPPDEEILREKEALRRLQQKEANRNAEGTSEMSP